MNKKRNVQFAELLGSTILSIEGMVSESENVTIVTDRGVFAMRHEQDCCEHVRLNDVVGDVADLIGHQVIKCEEATQEGETGWGTNTWTFYHISTIKGTVTLRWLGESNGYYSESVDFSFEPK